MAPAPTAGAVWARSCCTRRGSSASKSSWRSGASLILAELQDEQIWRQAFENTSDGQWDRIAGIVRTEIASGDTDSLDALLP